MKMLITELHLKNILLEYSNKLIDNIITRYQLESGDDSEEFENWIRDLIKRFDQIKTSPKIIEKDITKYWFEKLENTVTNFDKTLIKPIKIGTMFDQNNKLNPDKNLIYHKNNIRLYRADSKDDCIKYGTDYRFCVSSRGDRNFYNMYAGNTIYFLFDDNKSKVRLPDSEGRPDIAGNNDVYEDPNHILVILVALDKYAASTGKFTVYNAYNVREKIMCGDEKCLLSQFPILKNVINLLKHKDNDE